VRRFLVFAALATLVAAPLTAWAQGREVTGRVTVTGAGTPLADAQVGVVGQPIGTRTNERGEYRLQVPAGAVQLQARAIGYKRQQVSLDAGAATANFTLERDVLQLEATTVTGQATTIEKKNAATAISTLNTAELNRVPARSIEGQLAGKAVGVASFDNSGAPGGGAQLKIRGNTSVLGSGDPLYVVDGVIISNQQPTGAVNSVTRAGGGVGGIQDNMVNRLADLNPTEIESIEVLKSAAASAIYGSRATNGVVVITTKKGKAGTVRFNATQRVGTQEMIRKLGSRRYDSFADVADWTGGPTGTAAAQAACGTGACPWYDYQQQLYGRTDPSFETILSANGGVNNTRFFASFSDRQESGIMLNTGARRQNWRLNLDQQIGSKLTVSAGIAVTNNDLQRGLSNNDNSGTSPIYNWGYTPAIIDLRQRDASGLFVRQPFNGGGFANGNPFETQAYVRNDDVTWRQTMNTRVGYTVFTTDKQSLEASFVAGIDRFNTENIVYSPPFLQFEPADGFAGTSSLAQNNTRQFNQGFNLVHSWNPGWSWLASATTSVGGTQEEQDFNRYAIRQRGLLPGVSNANSGADAPLVENSINTFRDQSLYLNETLLMFGDKLAINAGLRADRSSANGDREKFYVFPKYSGSYRFVNPVFSFVDEVKLRGAFGQSGNRPRWADRDVVLANAGNIGGRQGLVAAGTLGNPEIKPEVMNETEYGVDAYFFGGRFGVELTNYDRTIKDLLLTFPLPPSSGLTQQIINGGELSVKGWEVGLTAVPIRRGTFEWTSRINFTQNEQRVESLPVPGFNAANSFGASYGRNRIVEGALSTWIWGNAPLGANGAVRDTILRDSNPIHQTQFYNEFSWKAFTMAALVDWRNGGFVANMTNNLWDEGGQAYDFDEPSPDPTRGATLGDYRNAVFNGGDIRPYIQNGSYVKVREITLTYQAPAGWAALIPGGQAKDLRFSLSGRNLWMFSDYWGFDPEFNNFGNTNFNRFIDLAPFPPSRQVFFSIDVGF
jgi:TonB-linked SusC/RagA family outer membrane protein